MHHSELPVTCQQTLFEFIMVEVTDYQLAYINSLMYEKKRPDGPVSDFSIFEESEEHDSGFQATLFTQEDQVRGCVDE